MSSSSAPTRASTQAERPFAADEVVDARGPRVRSKGRIRPHDLARGRMVRTPARGDHTVGIEQRAALEPGDETHEVTEVAVRESSDLGAVHRRDARRSDGGRLPDPLASSAVNRTPKTFGLAVAR